MSRRGWMVGGGALALVGVAMVLGSAGSASGTAGPSISFSPPSQNINAGTAEINIDIMANNVTNLGAYDITLKFDPSIIEFLGAGDYGFLSTTGRSQTCFGYGLPAATVNLYKVVHAGCGTNGLIDNGQGKPGPNGSAILAQVVFKAKSVGKSNLVFVGLGAEPFQINEDPPESGQTSLSTVEVCSGGICADEDIPFAPGTGVIQVFDPNAPTPTALPPTPTPEPPSDVDEDDFRATVAAAVGTPRTLATPVPGSSQAAAATAASQANGTTSAAGGSSGSIAASGTNGGLPEGATIGPDGIVRGPDGVPIAGYGPQHQKSNPLWVWGGVALLLWGLIAIGWGAATGRARQRVSGRDM